jgi:LuxR family transcriptional regulator, maltose regulon positive regulatory protein
VSEEAVARQQPPSGLRFARAKFRPPTLPGTLVTRPLLHDRLAAGSHDRLTVVVGSAGSGKSVLLADWVVTRPPGSTHWLACDDADANEVRFWTGFVEAVQETQPWFGVDAANLLAIGGPVSADIPASLANDAARLPAASVVVIDDFHNASPACAQNMASLIQNWPWQNAQLVLAGRSDPAVQLHRLRMSGELSEIRDPDLRWSNGDATGLLANFGVEIATADLELIVERSEGWAAALQMVALSLRAATGPERVERALEVRSRGIADYFAAEVLDQQPPEIARFMLETSVLDELSGDSCAAITEMADSPSLLRQVGAANLFLAPLDEEGNSYRYHHLVRQMLRAELRARDPAREESLHWRAGEWYEAANDLRQAAHHFLAARQPERALTLLQHGVVSAFLRDPALPVPLDLTAVDPGLLAGAPDQLLAAAADLMLRGDPELGGEYLDVLQRVWPSVPEDPLRAARFSAIRSLRHGLYGRLDESLAEAQAARAIQDQAHLDDEWVNAVGFLVVHLHAARGDTEGTEREARRAMATPQLGEPVKRVALPGLLAVTRLEAGYLDEATEAAQSAERAAERLGFSEHYFAVGHLRARAGLALERRDFESAEMLAEKALSISERGRPFLEFLALLDRAKIWAARGDNRDALDSLTAARRVLGGPASPMLAQADELEALVRLTLGDSSRASELALTLAGERGNLLLARVALASGDHQAARHHLDRTTEHLSPRLALIRQLLLVATAIERGDPQAAGSLVIALDRARRQGFLHTVVSTAPQVTNYLVEQSSRLRRDPFVEQVVGAAVQARAFEWAFVTSVTAPSDPLTPAELRVLKLLPTSTYLQLAAALYISQNTVKTHLRSIYQKFGVASRSAAIERAMDLRLL